MVTILISFLLAAAPPPDCTLTHVVEAGRLAPCDGVSLPSTYLAHLLRQEALLNEVSVKLTEAEAKLAAKQKELDDYKAEAERALAACEKGKVCLPCPPPPKPGLFEKPEFAWPVGLLVGFVGGVVFDAEVIRR